MAMPVQRSRPPVDTTAEKWRSREYRAAIDGRKNSAVGMLDLRDQTVLLSYRAYILLHSPTAPPTLRAMSCQTTPRISNGTAK